MRVNDAEYTLLVVSPPAGRILAKISAAGGILMLIPRSNDGGTSGALL
jgi:hypothetical protein